MSGTRKQHSCSCGGIRCAPANGDVVNRTRATREAHDELDENPSAADIERFSDVTRRCPECKKDVFDDSAVCYHCGHAFERTTQGSAVLPKWALIAAGVLIAAFVVGTLTGVLRIF